MTRWMTQGALIGAALVAMTGVASAQVDPEVFDEQVQKDAEDAKKKDKGWVAFIDLGASLALSSNAAVPGKPDGMSLTLGASVATGVSYMAGIHDWRNKLALQLAFTQTPVIPDQFVKTADSLNLSSAYYLRFVDWVGPFARFGLDTTMLSGRDVRAAESTFVTTRLDGTTETATGLTLSLTDPFQPLTMKQSLGAFIRPYQEKEADVEFRLGFGAREVFADGQFVVADNVDTPEVEVSELKSYVQVGAELAAEINGSLWDGKASYGLNAEAMIPFVADLPAGDDRSMLDLTNLEFGARLSFKLVEWASLGYEFKAVKQPQLQEDWQVQNNLLLTFGYSFRTDTPAKADAK